MIQINVRHDFMRFGRTLDAFSKKQMPFAAARALTATARDAGNAVTQSLPAVLDRPTPFTQKAIGIVSARKTHLTAEVFIRPRQAEYLGFQEEGGQRDPKRKALVMPVGVKLNQYGNMPRRALTRLQGRNDTFVGSVNGTGGIWQRTKAGGLKLLAAFRAKATYKPVLGFATTVERVVRSRFPERMAEALRDALRSARGR